MPLGATNLPSTTEVPVPQSAMLGSSFCAFPPHPYMELTVMNADGSGKTRLTNNYADEAQPDWGRARG